ncbi:MAG: uroporphyrinogen decarboxylase family protein [Anaerolineae bacterium]
MEQMTSKERITAAIEGQPVDHLPFCPFLAYVWEHMPKEIQDAGQLAFLQEIGADPMWRGAPCAVKQEMPGVEIRRRDEIDRVSVETMTPVGTLHSVWIKSKAGNTAFLFEHPVKTEEDFKIALWIEEHTVLTFDPTEMNEHLMGQGREGLSIGMLLPRGKTAFQSMVEHHIGTVELVYALADFPETVETLWQAMVANDLKATRISLEAPYQYYITWEDSSTQNYSPALYAKYIAPEILGFCEILGESGKSYIQHACGHVKDLLPHMVASGVKAVESISTFPTGNVTLKEARESIRSGLGIIGGIEPTRFLNSSMEELEVYIEQVIEDGSGGPFVLANSDSCPPGVTVDKFRLGSQIARRTTGMHT